MQLPRVGYVSGRPGARLHLAVVGRAHCGAGNGRISGTAQELTAKGAARVCRRCVGRIRAIVQEALHAAMRRRDTAATRARHACNAVLDALRTDAQVATEAAAGATIAERIRDARTQAPRPLSGLGLLRARHAAAVATDQLALPLPA